MIKILLLLMLAFSAFFAGYMLGESNRWRK